MTLEIFKKYIETKEDGRLKHREKKDLEFKANYNFGSIKTVHIFLGSSFSL